ncbi:MAG: DUF4239 domain-containing protein [Candidatus Eisenbacteria bacterium]
MLLLLEAGRRLGVWRISRDPAAAEAGLGTVEGAVFALFGLLVAFTFSGAGERFNSRRLLIAEEANDIGTAYLRLDLLPEAAQPVLRAEFRDYLSSRLEAYRRMPDLAAVKAELARSEELQRAIWSGAVTATRLEGAHPDAAKLLLPALNAMIDITTTRTMAARIHPPRIIYALLFVLALGCALMAGYGMAARRERSWLHILGFVVTAVIAIYVILDLEYPRRGLFRIDAYDQVLVELLESMN